MLLSVSTESSELCEMTWYCEYVQKILFYVEKQHAIAKGIETRQERCESVGCEAKCWKCDWNI